MIEGTSAASRRGLLRRAAVLALGALGLNATAGSVAAAQPAARSTVSTRTIHLWGRGFYLDGHGHRQGLVPADGDRGSVRGELLDAPGGEVVGTFASVCFFGTEEPGDLELHTFHLADGMLIGSGATTDGRGVCAVLGGTGAYAGASGTYAARQDLREVGGEGSAEFLVTLRS
jgi:hypothetical protein